MSTRPCLPKAFCDQTRELLGEAEAMRLLESLEGYAPTSIRINPHKFTSEHLPLESKPVPWCPWGYYLTKRPTFTGDPLFHSGYYYVQEASSMLLYQIQSLLDRDLPLTVLDLCAAPGGKSTLLLDLLPEGSTLLCNEVVPQRAHVLVENIQKWGNPRSIVCSTSPERLGALKATFDLILVDAPCSGEGMFRKDPETRLEWQASSPRVCADRQQTILDDIWPALRPGGLLLYSTCTINREENEDLLDYLVNHLEATPIELGEIGSGVWRSPLSDHPCYRMLPHRVQGEGLFLAVVRKGQAEDTATPSPLNKAKRQSKSKGKPTASTSIPTEVMSWVDLNSATHLNWSLDQEIITAYPQSLSPLLERLSRSKIKPLSYGLTVAELRGKSILPLAPLALSPLLCRDAFDWVELEQEQILPYLAREAITLPADLSAGIKLVGYRGIPLGFVKHLGNRSNNLYPMHWRIRHREQVERLQAEGSSD